MERWNLYKKLKTMAKYNLIILALLLLSCASQKQKSIYKGGVYVADTLIQNRIQNFDSIFPILALRIDNKKNDTLFIKYRAGREVSMDFDAVYNEGCNCYYSTIKVPFAPFGEQREFISIYFLSNEKIKISYQSQNEYFFSLTHIDKINLKTHRNIYYAEEGFKLFKD